GAKHVPAISFIAAKCRCGHRGRQESSPTCVERSVKHDKGKTTMKKQKNKSSSDQNLTRRQILGLLGLATATGLAMPSLRADAAVLLGASPFDDSVFKDTCRDGNGTKYNNYDNPLAYPIVAFWLMLTTDEWGTCMTAQSGGRTDADAQQWRTKL